MATYYHFNGLSLYDVLLDIYKLIGAYSEKQSRSIWKELLAVEKSKLWLTSARIIQLWYPTV